MKILAFDTAMAACSVAVIDSELSRPLAEAFVPMERGHAEALAPMVAHVMSEAGVGFSDIDRIGVTTGPGTFTGVRIGLALARGIGVARNIPVIGIDTLRAIAANDTSEYPLLVLADARNGEVFAARFDTGRNVVLPPHVVAVAHAVDQLPAGTVVAGTAARAAVDASGRKDLVLSRAGDLPVAARFAHLAAAATAGPMPSPLYLRAPDAKPQLSPLRKMSVLSFQSAPPDSAALLSAMHGETFEDGWSEQAFDSLLRTPGAVATISLDHDEPVGFVLTRSAADEAEILAIGTRPFAQRRGVARQMIDHQLAELQRQGIRHVFLEVADTNAAARGLYAALGFQEAGRRKGYYKRASGVAEDAFVMRRELTP